MLYLVGQNIELSLSPLLHRKMLQMKGKKYSYELWKGPQPPGKQWLMTNNDWKGLSITIPYKQHYQDMEINYIGKYAEKTRIINTLVREKATLYGFNTDVYGIQHTLAPYKARIQGKNVLLFGAGATAFTMCQCLSPSVANIYVYNRTKHKIALLNQHYPKVSPIPQDSPVFIDAIFNTIPQKGVQKESSSIQQLLSSTKFPEQLVFMDLDYRTDSILKSLLPSQLLELKGLDMLIWQAIQQNAIFCRQPHEELSYSSTYFSQLRQIIKL